MCQCKKSDTQEEDFELTQQKSNKSCNKLIDFFSPFLIHEKSEKYTKNINPLFAYIPLFKNILKFPITLNPEGMFFPQNSKNRTLLLFSHMHIYA